MASTSTINASIVNEAKIRLLQSNDDWRERYDSLVKTGFITDSLFWNDKRAELDSMQAYIQLQSQKSKDSALTTKQRIAAVLKRMRGVSDGKGEVKFRLTTEIITSIYSTLPRIKQLHEEFVKTGMLTEKDFWTQFCSSRTFGKDLGVGEDFSGKKGNIFDRAFPDSLEGPNEEAADEDSPAQIVPTNLSNNSIDIAMNEGNELLEDHAAHLDSSLKIIRQLNNESIKSLHGSDISSRLGIQPTTDSPDVPNELKMDKVTTAENEEGDYLKNSSHARNPSVRPYDPNYFHNVKLLTFSEYKEKAMLLPIAQASFAKITPEDFAGNRFDQIKGLYQNVIFLLRIFWRCQPMNTTEKQGNCSQIMSVIEGLLSDFANLQWGSGEEREKAEMLLTCMHDCITSARSRFASK